MKKITLLSLLLCLGYFTQAQIVINPSDITFDTTGHIFYYTDVQFNTISTPQGGADMLWDYSAAQPDGSSYPVVYESVSDPNYPGANCRRTISTTYVSLTLPQYRYHRFDATGFRVIGYEELSLAFPLGGVTGNAADTLFFVGGPRIESQQGNVFFNLPMAYGDTSYTETQSDVLMLANIPTFGLNNFTIKQNIKRTDDIEIIGWGKLALVNPTTLMVDTFETLLQKRTQVRTDNYYDAANNPLPANLLAPLGLSQNTVTTNVYYAFFVKGVNQLAFTIGTNANGSINSAFFNDELFTLGTPVSTTPKNNFITKHQIFPNPIQNHQFQLEIEKNNAENWQLDIYNVLGQSVHNELIINNISTIELNDNLPSGQYFYTIRNENGQTMANGKLMK